MILGRVLGPLVSTVKHPAYAGLKLLVVQPVDEAGAPLGKSLLAVDRVSSAGEGDLVLVLKEGTGVRQLFGLPKDAKLPIQACIVGVVDRVYAEAPAGAPGAKAGR